MILVVAKLWANLSGFLWWHSPDKASLCLVGRDLGMGLPYREEDLSVASPFLSLPREECWLRHFPEGTDWLLQTWLRAKPCPNAANQDRFVLETCFSRVVWLTYYLLPILGNCWLWLNVLLKTVDKIYAPPRRAGLHTAWSAHTKYSSLKCKVGAGQKTSYKYGQGIIVVGTTAATRVKFISQIIHREAHPKKSSEILLANNTLTFCHSRQCDLIEDSWLLSREVDLWISLS